VCVFSLSEVPIHNLDIRITIDILECHRGMLELPVINTFAEAGVWPLSHLAGLKNGAYDSSMTFGFGKMKQHFGL
jgi:hypothetical protein